MLCIIIECLYIFQNVSPNAIATVISELVEYENIGSRKFIIGVVAIISVVHIARKNHIFHIFHICSFIKRKTISVPTSTVAIMYKNDVFSSNGGLVTSWFPIIIGLNSPVDES